VRCTSCLSSDVPGGAFPSWCCQRRFRTLVHQVLESGLLDMDWGQQQPIWLGYDPLGNGRRWRVGILYGRGTGP